MGISHMAQHRLLARDSVTPRHWRGKPAPDKLYRVARIPNSELGKRLGVSPSMASRIRNGERLPSTRVLNQLHREYGVPLATLMDAHTKGPAALAEAIKPYLSAPEPEAQAA